MQQVSEVPRETSSPDESQGSDQRPLHYVDMRTRVALCGFVLPPWEPFTTDTRGRDRCTKCLAIIARLKR